MRIDNAGVGIHVEVDGPEGAPPVVVLHGISSSTATYDFLPAELPHHRLFRVDFRGHGRSDRVPGGYDLDGFASDAEAVLEEVGPAVVVGHSLGGITAAYVAQRRPELVAALFLEDPPLYFGEPGVYESTPFAQVFPLIQAAVVRWQTEGTSAEEIAAAMASAPSLSGQATMGEEVTPDSLAASGTSLSRLDPEVFTPLAAGTSLAGFDPGKPIPAAGMLLQPDRELGAAFYDDHAARLAATSPEIDVVRMRGVGHLIHESITHRAEYLEHLRRFLARYRAA
jgi:pimeloyl-ACP methyl ester carboxylesterase